MSGGKIAYHLRPNKAADRSLFFDLLARIGRAFNISDYRYYGFGGPFMEDFRALHSALRISKLYCIERDATVQARQIYNSPVKGINWILSDASAFLTTFQADEPTVAWLDFTSPGELKQQLDDTRVLVSKLAEGDVFKVTLNANIAALRESAPGLKEDELATLRRKTFEKRAEDYAPKSLKDTDFRLDYYPTLLLQALLAAAHRGISASPSLYVQPLSAYAYSDGTPMLTATGIVLEKTKREQFLEATRLEHWPFASLDWKYPLPIDLPVLSIRERLALESLMPNGTISDAKGVLGSAVGKNGIEPVEISSFKQFYRIYPEFVRVGS